MVYRVLDMLNTLALTPVMDNLESTVKGDFAPLFIKESGDNYTVLAE